PATRAREVYEQVVRRDIDPALLEWSGGNTFAARVFPIEPHSVKRVVLVYEETLPVGGDLLRYTYPLPDAEELGRIDFRLSVAPEHSKLAAGEVISQAWAPPTSKDGWTTHYLDLAPRAGASIDLAFTPRDPRAQVLEASAPRGFPGSAFFARLRPDIPATEQAARTGRALFLVDTSLSGAGSADGSSVLLLEKILELDGTIDEYAVVLFDLRARWLHAPAWRPNDAASRKETHDEISKIYLEGATSFDATLEELDRQRSWLFDAAKPVHAFLLSDGFITWGQDHADVLLARHESAASCRWISYQLGRSPVNRGLFDALARVSRGRTVTVLTRGEIPAGALAHRTSPAVLKGVTVEGVEPADLVVAGDPTLLFPGEEIQIAGRLASAGARAELVVAASIDGKDAAWRVPLQGGGASTMAARAWAELQAAKLLALDDERLDRMITALSQRFQLANRTASFLILEKEADYTLFDLEAETIDLEALEKLRITEEDQRRDRLQGIALDGAPELGIETVAILGREAERGVAIVPASLPPAFLDRPLAGGDERIAAEAAYREARAKNDLDSRTYDAVARVRALSGDSVGALRAYSSLVEKMPGSAEAAKLAGYACMALGQYVPAAEVFERVRLDRPFEPQSYLEEAMALEAAREWGKAARNYEIILSRSFPRHEEESRVVAARRYARLLAKRLGDEGLDAESRKVLEGRRAEVTSLEEVDVPEDVDLEVTIHWNTSSTDVDLWVREPEGERCYYDHRESAAGGRLFWDITDGYGPEIYTRKKAGPGVFEVLAHYFGNNSARWSVPTAVLVLRDRGGSAPWEGAAPRCQVRILGAEDAVMSLVKEEF
ncbi:MAG TPA: hypothetical protein VMT52_07460, partial [Planctomycetota bacterium]|nr:hypothetical protein [Planctomycetota bacterium]